MPACDPSPAGPVAIDRNADPFAAAPYPTAPFPAYVSFWSALAYHDMIEQIPRVIHIASLDRAKRIDTPLADYSIHHLAPELFGGFEGAPEIGYVATSEKALFDTAYVPGPRGGRAYFPELTLPTGFHTEKAELWLERIPRQRLRTIVRRRLEVAINQAGGYRDAGVQPRGATLRQLDWRTAGEDRSLGLPDRWGSLRYR